MKPFMSAFESSKLKKNLDFFKKNGISGVMSNVKYRMSGPGLAYNGWFKERHEASLVELDRQRDEVLPYTPMISVIVPVFPVSRPFYSSMIASVRRQSYENWELLIVDVGQVKIRREMMKDDGDSIDITKQADMEQMIKDACGEDMRIRCYVAEGGQTLNDSMTRALMTAYGEYIVFLHQDDMFTSDALYEVVKACNEFPYDFLYSDEDRCSYDGSRYSDPSLKPDFSLDLLRSYNYFGHLTAVKRTIALKAVENSGIDGAGEYDFNLKCIEECVEGFPENPLAVMAGRTLGRMKDITLKPLDTSRIKHIPRVLYHARTKTKKNDDEDAQRDAEGELMRKALSRHLDRTVGYATAVKTNFRGIVKAKYDAPGNPKVSIIIPGYEERSLMEKCILPLYDRARYSDFEIIIIDIVGDEESEVTKFYRAVERKRKNLRTITETGMVNTAELRNIGASRAVGEVLFFLDGNVELLDATSLGEMVGNCIRDEVGVVGGTLYNDMEVLYKQGIILGVNGLADYPNRGIKRGSMGYLLNNCVNSNYLAVPAACMMVKKLLFDKVGGFDARFAGDAAAIDFCLKAREHRASIVTVADAGWIFHEPARRHHMQGFDEENERMLRQRWGLLLDNPDPFYNVNFKRRGDIFGL